MIVGIDRLEGRGEDVAVFEFRTVEDFARRFVADIDLNAVVVRGLRFADDIVSRDELVFSFPEAGAEAVYAVPVDRGGRADDRLAEVVRGDRDLPQIAAELFRGDGQGVCRVLQPDLQFGTAVAVLPLVRRRGQMTVGRRDEFLVHQLRRVVRADGQSVSVERGRNVHVADVTVDASERAVCDRLERRRQIEIHGIVHFSVIDAERGILDGRRALADDEFFDILIGKGILRGIESAGADRREAGQDDRLDLFAAGVPGEPRVCDRLGGEKVARSDDGQDAVLQFPVEIGAFAGSRAPVVEVDSR